MEKQIIFSAPIIYGSVCSGVEAATVAWHHMGWKPAWLCEFDKFPSEILAHHYPDVPNLHDMTKIEERKEYNDRPINLLVGGTPCQSFSIAGLRKGLDDSRGNLALKFCEILRDRQPRWFVWENVPGVLSSDEGRDFAAILSGFRECGYGIAYRLLDAQYFGVAQRRRRLFVVGYLGDWRPAAAVLFEQDSLHGNPAPRRKKRQDVAGSFGKSVKGSHWDGEAHPSLSQSHNTGAIGYSNQELFSQRGAGLVPCRMAAFGEYVQDETASTIKQRDYKDATDLVTVSGNQTAHTLTAEIQDASEDGTGRGTPIITVHGTQDPDILYDKSHTLGRNNGQENAICYSAKLNHTGSNGIGIDEEKACTLDATSTCGQAMAYGFKAGQGAKAGGIGFEEEVAPTLTAGDSGTQKAPTILYENHMQDSRVKEVENASTISAKAGTGGGNIPLSQSGMSVRRLTPVECERLQGFPDNYTAISWRGKDPEDCPDGHRYKAMGNSMAVPCMGFIGKRIQMVEDILNGKND